MKYNEQEVERFRTILDFHLTKEQKLLPALEQKSLIEGKKKRIRFLNIINVAGAAFFMYWFLADITQLSDIVMYVILGVFVLNLLALNVQRKQLNEVMEYLEEQHNSSS